jgi:hypothetical protein
MNEWRRIALEPIIGEQWMADDRRKTLEDFRREFHFEMAGQTRICA